MHEIKEYGDQALIVIFGDIISPKFNDLVIILDEQIKLVKGVHYTIPAYSSLTIVYDRAQTTKNKLGAKIEAIISSPREILEANKRKINVPVCYHPSFAIDIEGVMAYTKCSHEEIITLHSSTCYRVYMLGFLPGFPYLGILNPRLSISRKKIPTLNIVSGSVGIARQQTGIYPFDSPGGWQIIGRTPLVLFSPNELSPFLFQSGDEVSFNPISLDDYNLIKEEIHSGHFKIERIYE